MAMNGFTKYVLRQLFVGMVLVTLGLTTNIWLSQSLRFIEMIYWQWGSRQRHAGLSPVPM